MYFNQIQNIKQIPDLQQVNINGKRWYVTENGVHLPSVTSVLEKSDYIKNIILEKWKLKVGEEKSIEIKNKATSRGNNLHNMCQKYLSNQPLDFTLYEHSLDSIDMFKKIQVELDLHVNNIHCVEKRLYSEKLGVAGTVDCIGEWDQELTVIDFKNSKSKRTASQIGTYFQQTTAYALMFTEITGIKITKGKIIMAVEDEPVQIFNIKVIDYIEPLLKAIQKYTKANSSN